MSKRHHRSKADRRPVTRRYLARTVQRARDDVIQALLFATRQPDDALETLDAQDWQRLSETTASAVPPSSTAGRVN